MVGRMGQPFDEVHGGAKQERRPFIVEPAPEHLGRAPALGNGAYGVRR